MDKRSNMADAFLKMAKPFSLVTIIFASITLIGYVFAQEAFYRPITHGPATNPLTAMVLIFLGFSIVIRKPSPFSVFMQRTLSITALLIVSIRIIDALQQTHLSATLTPFYDVVLRELEQGKNNSMGINTAIMLAAASLSIFFYSLNQRVISQLIASIALTIPMITFLGYAYGMEKYYGQMSMLTATNGFILSFSALCLTADTGFLQLLLSRSKKGVNARYRFSMAYFLPVLTGYFLVKSVFVSSYALLSLSVISLCWFITFTMGCWTFYAHRGDVHIHNDKKEPA